MLKFTAEKSVTTYTDIELQPGIYYSRYSESDDENTYRRITVTEDKISWLTIKNDSNIISITFTPPDDYIPFQIERVFESDAKNYHKLTEVEFNALYHEVLQILTDKF